MVHVADDVVEALRQQCRGLGYATFDDADGAGVEISGDERRQHLRDMRCQFARLEHDRVAGGATIEVG